jgi:hypothetical protein
LSPHVDLLRHSRLVELTNILVRNGAWLLRDVAGALSRADGSGVAAEGSGALAGSCGAFVVYFRPTINPAWDQ